MRFKCECSVRGEGRYCTVWIQLHLPLDIEKITESTGCSRTWLHITAETYMYLYSKSAFRSVEEEMLWKGPLRFWTCKGLTWPGLSGSVNLSLHPIPACIFLSDWEVLTGRGTCCFRMFASVLVIWGHFLTSAPTSVWPRANCFKWKIPAIHSSYRKFSSPTESQFQSKHTLHAHIFILTPINQME